MKLMGNDLHVSFSLGHSSESICLARPKKKKRKKSQTYGKLKEDSDAVLF